MKDILRLLLEVEHALTALIIHAPAASDDELAGKQRMAGLRDRVDAAINRVIELRFQAAVVDLTSAAGRLEKLQEQLAAVQRTVEGIRQGVEIGGQVLQVVAEVIAAVAG